MDRAQALEMRGRDAGDDAHVRLRDLRQAPDLARPVHAELEDRRFLRAREAEQGEREADQVVLRARRAQHPPRAEGARQDRGQHLLGGRLAVAAGHGHDARAATPAMERGQVAERGERVAHRDDAAAERPLRMRALDHDRARAALGRVPQEVVPVVRLAADGDEELARPEAPAVGRDPREAGAGTQSNELPAGGGEDLLQREGRRGRLGGLAHASLPRARRTSSRSSRWRFTVPTIW